MGTYVPTTASEREEMLRLIGVSTIEELHGMVPADMLVSELNLPEGMSELEVSEAVTEMAEKNKVFKKR